MPIRTEIIASFYQDSVVLMGLAAELRARPGVREAAAFMGTPANLALLTQAGLIAPESCQAGSNDLILTVDALSEAEAEAALAAARERLAARRRAVEGTTDVPPRTLDSALRRLPEANLVVISVPGAYAALEAKRALRRNLHVLVFSDNVPVAEEAELKREALRRGLLCMGPDCGTAYLNGTGLGFANVVRRGRVGCVAASGTGLQAVACRVDALGEGISHGIGVGGRDLSSLVGGAMTLFALGALASDPGTEAIVVVAKPPHPEVMPHLEAGLEAIDKPVAVCFPGVSRRAREGHARWVETLDEAADAVVAMLRNEPWAPRSFRDPGMVRTRLHRIREHGDSGGSGLLGLYTGGTLAHEARALLEPLLGPISDEGVSSSADVGHRILDLGDDVYTVGRPHPMIDPDRRSALVLEAGDSSQVGVLLADLVLGRGAHHDPARPLVHALERARSRAGRHGRRLHAVVSVIGTPTDPQNLAAQVAELERADVTVFQSNAEAARFAAMLVKPEIASLLLPKA